jgi:hypothetical protein
MKNKGKDKRKKQTNEGNKVRNKGKTKELKKDGS